MARVVRAHTHTIFSRARVETQVVKVFAWRRGLFLSLSCSRLSRPSKTHTHTHLRGPKDSLSRVLLALYHCLSFGGCSLRESTPLSRSCIPLAPLVLPLLSTRDPSLTTVFIIIIIYFSFVYLIFYYPLLLIYFCTVVVNIVATTTYAHTGILAPPLVVFFLSLLLFFLYSLYL